MNLFNEFDFSLLETDEFKEDSVREELIIPILKALGYRSSGKYKISRSKRLIHPFVMIGSKEYPINIFPDYVLEIENKPFWVLDAKSPDEEVEPGKNANQAYSYSIHPEIRAKFYALCNGYKFNVYAIDKIKPILSFDLIEIDKYWSSLSKLLSPKSISLEDSISEDFKVIDDIDYLNKGLLEEILVKKQAAKRHFGVHGYFTRQPWNVVHEYIRHFTQIGDVVLDPFAGTGVTAIESLVLDRKAINIELNPLPIFWVNSMLQPVSQTALLEEGNRVLKRFQKERPKTKKEISNTLKKYPLPKNVTLPKGSDVPYLHDLFTKKQLAELVCLRAIIKKIKQKNIKDLLLLAFSSSVNKHNKTFHYSNSPSGGDSGIFKYYRYRIAPKPGDLDLYNTYRHKLKLIIRAKSEIDTLIDKNTLKSSIIERGDATNLGQISNESIDYIYTDPPYGSKIPYLDLSSMWNAWLGLNVSKDDLKNEVIEGGSLNKSDEEYFDLIEKSLEEMFRVLKWNRWMSFVFQHRDPKYWHLIVGTAEKLGFEYAGSVKQSSGQSSFKKRQHPFTVLSGQMIINFRKVKNPTSILRQELGVTVSDMVLNNIEALIADKHGTTVEEIYEELVIQGLEHGYLDVLSKEYTDLTPLLNEHFNLNTETNKYQLKENAKFKSYINVELRIRYFITSYLQRKNRQNVYPTFDEIVLNIMPLLRNGETPEHQTILSVLEEIGERVINGRWRLSTTPQMELGI